MIFKEASDFNTMGNSKPHTPPGENHHPPSGNKPVPPHPNKPNHKLTIVVNGVDKVLPEGTKQLSYEDIVRLAYGEYVNTGNVIYTVVYSKGPHENHKGTMVKGSVVFVKEGMIFNVGRSDKS